MGIPSYFSDLVKKNPRIMKPVHGKIFTDILLFDGNSIIYDAYYSLKSTDIFNGKNKDFIVNKVIQETKTKIKEIIQQFSISSHIVFFLDGIAPIAKLKQQRERRYKTLLRSKVLDDGTDQDEYWNTCNISPGTDFMTLLNEELSRFFEFINKDIKRCEFFGSDVPGEGEHKLFQWLRQKYNVSHADFNTFSKIPTQKIKDKICVVGLDSDLIMLSLLHYNLFDNIFLYRETPDFISSIHPSLCKHVTYIIYMDGLVDTIKNSFFQDDCHCEAGNPYHITMNYVILYFLIGNDFIPHHPSLSLRTLGSEQLHHALSEVISQSKSLYRWDESAMKYVIDWSGMNIIFLALAQDEYSHMVEFKDQKSDIRYKIENRVRYSKKESNDKRLQDMNDMLFHNLPLFYEDEENYICDEKNYSDRYYEYYHQPDNTSYLCYHYFSTIQWVLDYYVGLEVDKSYSYPYTIAPLFSDLHKNIVMDSYELKNTMKQKYTDFVNMNDVRKQKGNITHTTPHTSNIHPITQLIYILPSDYHSLIPHGQYSRIRSYIEIQKEKNSTDYLCEYMKNIDINIKSIHYGFCRYFFEAAIEFHYNDVIELNMIIENIFKTNFE